MPYRKKNYQNQQRLLKAAMAFLAAGGGGLSAISSGYVPFRRFNRGSAYKKAVSQVLRKKGGRSRTKTRKRNFRGNPMASPQVMPSLSFQHGKNPPRISNARIKAIRNALVPANNYNKTSTKQMDLTTNGQSLWGVIELYSPSDVGALLNSVSSEPSTRCQATGAALQALVANATNQNCFVDVYDCICRRDLGSTETNMETVLQNGFVDTEQKTDDVASTDLVSTPYKNPRFVQYARILGVRKYQMPPGGQMRLSLTDKSDHLLVDGWQTDKAAYAGLTRFLAIKLTGSVVSDSTTETAISTGTARLNFVIKTQYTYKWIEDNDVSSFQTTSLGTITNESAINPLTGEEQANVES